MSASAAGNLDNAFWTFSLAVYAVPGVANECLAVQERFGVDVNMLLFCAWLAFARRVALTPHDIATIGAAVSDWHETAIKTLREVRRYMKNVPGGDVAALRTRVKAAELEAEQVEQAILFLYVEQRWPLRGEGYLPIVLRANLEAYLRAQGYHGPGGEGLPLSHLCAAVLALPATT